MGTHDHSRADYIAIGDDDLVRVPPDWLTNMIKTARAFPGCGCVGGKALTPGWPPIIHGGVHNHTSFGPTGIITTNVKESIDLAQFDFIDMVHHVIGCLHMYDRAAMVNAPVRNFFPRTGRHAPGACRKARPSL